MTNLKARKLQPHICSRCKGDKVAVTHKSDVVDFRGLTLEVEGLAETQCRACGLVWETPGQEQDNLHLLKTAFAAKRDAVRDKEGLLTGEQILDILNSLELSKAEAAALFGGGPNAFAKYISGEVLQSFAMDRLLRLTVAFGVHAIRVLEQGANSSLIVNSGGYFVARAIEVNTARAFVASATETDYTLVQVTRSTSAVQVAQAA